MYYGSGSYLLTHGRISCRKSTKFSVKLAKCNICLCYFIHKVKILIHSSHKWPALTIIWIQLIFTDTQAHFLLEIDKIWCEASLKKKEPRIRFVFSDARAQFLSEIDKIWYEASQVQYLSLLFSS